MLRFVPKPVATTLCSPVSAETVHTAKQHGLVLETYQSTATAFFSEAAWGLPPRPMPHYVPRKCQGNHDATPRSCMRPLLQYLQV